MGLGPHMHDIFHIIDISMKVSPPGES